MTNKVWTFTMIDYDMLADDQEYADCISPALAYSRREDAEKELVDEINSFGRMTIGEEFTFDPYKIVWKNLSDLSGDFERYTFDFEFEGTGIRQSFCLYQMEIR